MTKARSIAILLVFLGILLLQPSTVKAASINASFSTINNTVSLNQNVFFNLSAYFPQTVTYTVYLNNKSVLSGSLPADFPGFKTLSYNVTNLPAGSYQPTIKYVSQLSSSVLSGAAISINPDPDFSFAGYSNYTTYHNSSAKLLIDILNSGNTPLNFTWTLPIVQGVAFSLQYQQIFSLLPSQSFKIPINMTLSGSFTRGLNMSFTASYKNTVIRKNYITELFSPIINMTFNNGNFESGSGNISYYNVQLKNSNNLPVNTTFRFLLDIQGNDLYYNKSVTIFPSTHALNFTLPKSQLVQVSAFYMQQNGSEASEQIFNQPTSSSPSISDLLTDVLYVAILIIAVLLLVWLHIRFNKK